MQFFLKQYTSHYSGLPLSAWHVISINFVDSIIVGACYFITIYFVKQLGFNVAFAGMMMSFYGIGTVFGGLSGGKLSDIYSPSRVAIISLLIQAIAFLTLTYAESTSLIVITLFLLGTGSYGFVTSSHLWILGQCDKHENSRLKAINILSVVSNLGMGLSALIISLFASLNFTYIFLSCSVITVFSAFFLMNIETKNIKSAPILDAAILNDEVATDKHSKKMLLWISLICVFLIGLIIAQKNSTYPIYIESTYTELGIKAVSILFMLNTFIVVLFQAPFVNLFSTYNKVIVMGIGAFILGLGVALLNVSYFFIFAIFACIVETIGEMLFFSVAQLICYENGGEKKKGQSLGIYRTIYASSRIVGPALGGAAYHAFGGKGLWSFCGIVGCICLAICLGFREYE